MGRGEREKRERETATDEWSRKLWVGRRTTKVISFLNFFFPVMEVFLIILVFSKTVHEHLLSSNFSRAKQSPYVIENHF